MEKPKEPTICHLEVCLMPNGEVIYLGKTLGWFPEMKKHLSPEKE